MIDYIKDAIHSIHNRINETSNSSNNIFLLCADEGIGKTTVANEYCKLYKDSLCFRCGDEYALASSMVRKSLHVKYDRKTHIFRPMIKLVKKQRIQNLIFDIDTITSEDFLDLIMQIFHIFEQQDYHLNLLIFINNVEYQNYQIYFSRFPRITFLFPLKKWQKHDFIQLWCEIYPACEPDLEMISLISDYSIGNVGVFLQNLNTLKFLNLIIYNGKQLTIKSYEQIEEILKEKYSEIVVKKYEALPENLQFVIKKASSIGKIFSTKDLKRAFNIKNATLLIQQIEKLSMLLYYSEQNNGTGKFDTEDVWLQIEEMIEEEQFITWCEVLGNYYEKMLKEVNLNSIEENVLKEKCIFYFSKSQNIERVIFHCITIIPIQFRLCQYKSSINYTEKLIRTVKERSEFKSLYIECFRILAIINKTLANYEESLKNLNKFVSLLGFETYETEMLNAELLYCLGDTPCAYGILNTLYSKLDKIDDPHLKSNIVSMLSSIKETCGEEYIKLFNEALYISKQNGLYYDYYRLLRKANIAHFGEIGITLMKTAEEYYKDNNLIAELIMVQHNIGTEALFYENTFKYSTDYLHKAYKSACEIGFVQLCYINNSIALSAILSGNYQQALCILEHMLETDQEDFTLLALYLNLATCFRKKNLKTKFTECVNKAIEINSKPQNRFPFYTGQIELQEAYYYIETHDYKTAICKINEYLNNGYEDRTASEISVKIVLKELYKKTNSIIPDFLVNFANDTDLISLKMASERLVLCELFFWE